MNAMNDPRVSVGLGFGAISFGSALIALMAMRSPNYTDRLPGGDYVQFYLAGKMVRDGGRSADRLHDDQ